MADVFISYAREDQEVAGQLVAALLQDGFSVWWDPQLRFGEDIHQAVDEALRESRCVLVLWSTRSRDSQWVRDEAQLARDAGKLVPVAVDAQDAIPLGFRQQLSADLSAWTGDPSAQSVRALLAQLRERLAMASQSSARSAGTPPSSYAPSTSPAPRPKGISPALGAAVALLGLGALVVWRAGPGAVTQAEAPFEFRIVAEDGSAVPSGGRLCSGDSFHLELLLPSESFVYILLTDSSNLTSRVYPSEATGLRNPLAGKVRIPLEHNLVLDQLPGRERFYVYARREQMAGVQAFEALAADPDANLHNVAGRFRGVFVGADDGKSASRPPPTPGVDALLYEIAHESCGTTDQGAQVMGNAMDPKARDIGELARDTLATQLAIDPAQVSVTAVSAVEWSDASLGCPEPGFGYPQVITPGYRVTLQVGGEEHVVHTNTGRRAVVCPAGQRKPPYQSQ